MPMGHAQHGAHSGRLARLCACLALAACGSPPAPLPALDAAETAPIVADSSPVELADAAQAASDLTLTDAAQDDAPAIDLDSSAADLADAASADADPAIAETAQDGAVDATTTAAADATPADANLAADCSSGDAGPPGWLFTLPPKAPNALPDYAEFHRIASLGDGVVVRSGSKTLYRITSGGQLAWSLVPDGFAFTDSIVTIGPALIAFGSIGNSSASKWLAARINADGKLGWSAQGPGTWPDISKDKEFGVDPLGGALLDGTLVYFGAAKWTYMEDIYSVGLAGKLDIATGQVLWERVYHWSTPTCLGPIAGLVANADGSLTAAVNAEYTCKTLEYCIVKLTSTGVPTSKSCLPFPLVGIAAAPGGYVVLGVDKVATYQPSVAHLIRIDAAGKTLWKADYPLKGIAGSLPVVGPVAVGTGFAFGGALVQGGPDPGQAFVAAVTGDGTLAWSKDFAAPAGSVFRSLSGGADGVWLAGSWHAQAKVWKAWLLHLDAKSGCAVPAN